MLGLVGVCRGGFEMDMREIAEKIRNRARRTPDSDVFPLEVWLYSYIKKESKKGKKKGKGLECDEVT